MSEVICPHCQNPIYDDEALLCHFCGNSLNRASSGALGKMRHSGMKAVWITVVGLVLLGFIMIIM